MLVQSTRAKLQQESTPTGAVEYEAVLGAMLGNGM